MIVRSLFTIVLVINLSPVCCAQLSVEAVERALDIAEQAAEHGLSEVSIRAAVGALRFGPPTRIDFPSADAIRHWGARVDTSKPIPPGPAESLAQRIPELVRELEAQWIEQAGAKRAYLAMRDVVLPDEQAFRSFPYAERASVNPLQPDRFVPVNSLAMSLVDSAIRANALPDLARSILDRTSDNSVQTYALALLVALRLSDTEADGDVVRLVKRLQDSLDLDGMAMTSEQSELIASVATLYYRDRRYPKVASRVFASIIRSFRQSQGMDSPARNAIALLAARAQFAAGQPEAAAASLAVYIGPAATSPAQRQSRTRRQDTASRELFSRGLISEARELLPEEIVAAYARRYRLAPDSKPTTGKKTVRISDRNVRIVPTSDARSLDDQIWICRLDLTSGVSRTLFALPDFAHVSSPSISPDGRLLAFDACFPGEPVTSAGRIYVADIEKLTIRHVVDGVMPSWSPQGKRLAYSAFSPSRGVWMIRANGEEAKLVDPSGWAARWSPNGGKIAYSRIASGSQRLAIYDLIENEYFDALGREGMSKSVFASMEWTPDGKSIVACLHSPASPSAVVQAVSVLQKQSRRIATLESTFGNSLAVDDDDNVVCVIRQSGNTPEQLFLVSRQGDAMLKIKGQFSERRNTGVTYSADGHSLIYVSKPNRK